MQGRSTQAAFRAGSWVFARGGMVRGIRLANASHSGIKFYLFQ